MRADVGEWGGRKSPATKGKAWSLSLRLRQKKCNSEPKKRELLLMVREIKKLKKLGRRRAGESEELSPAQRSRPFRSVKRKKDMTILRNYGKIQGRGDTPCRENRGENGGKFLCRRSRALTKNCLFRKAALTQKLGSEKGS